MHRGEDCRELGIAIDEERTLTIGEKPGRGFVPDAEAEVGARDGSAIGKDARHELARCGRRMWCDVEELVLIAQRSVHALPWHEG